MYINVQKLGRIFGGTIAMLIIVIAIASYAFALTAQAQIASTLLGLFGLHLLWFITWLGRK